MAHERREKIRQQRPRRAVMRVHGEARGGRPPPGLLYLALARGVARPTTPNKDGHYHHHHDFLTRFFVFCISPACTLVSAFLLFFHTHSKLSIREVCFFINVRVCVCVCVRM